MYMIDDNGKVIENELRRLRKIDIEVANRLKTDELLEGCVWYGQYAARALNDLSGEAAQNAQEILDELVQECADQSENPDEGSVINNQGIVYQVAYLMAYNGLKGFDTVVKTHLSDFIQDKHIPDFMRPDRGDVSVARP